MAADLTFLSLDGDGIGPEIMAATLGVLDAARPYITREVHIERDEIGFATLETMGTTITGDVVERARPRTCPPPPALRGPGTYCRPCRTHRWT